MRGESCSFPSHMLSFLFGFSSFLLDAGGMAAWWCLMVCGLVLTASRGPGISQPPPETFIPARSVMQMATKGSELLSIQNAMPV